MYSGSFKSLIINYYKTSYLTYLRHLFLIYLVVRGDAWEVWRSVYEQTNR